MAAPTCGNYVIENDEEDYIIAGYYGRESYNWYYGTAMWLLRFSPPCEDADQDTVCDIIDNPLLPSLDLSQMLRESFFFSLKITSFFPRTVRSWIQAPISNSR